MSAAQLEKIRKDAESLTSEEKSKLMDYLLVDAQQEPVEISTAWIAEIERRAADMESGHDPGIPWEKVQADLKNPAVSDEDTYSAVWVRHSPHAYHWPGETLNT